MDRGTALTIATAYADEVCKVFAPLAIILYGSYANDTAATDSDIDVAVIFEGYDGNWLQDSATLWKLTRKVNTNIEPILLDRAQDPSGFVDKIRNSGEIIYEKGI